MLKRWEYKLVDLRGIIADDNEILNSYGEKGWELVAVTEFSEAVTAYFKKEKEE